MQLWVNNWSAVLTAEATISAVQLSVDPAAAAQLVNLTEGNYYLPTLVEQDGTGQEIAWEVVKVTGQAGGVLTVERAHEGAARVWPSGTLLQVRLTAGTLARIDAAAAGGGSGGGAAVGDLLTTRRVMPSEWLPVDGAILAQASYPALAGLLGTRWARATRTSQYAPITTGSLGSAAYGNGVYVTVRQGNNGVLRSTDNGLTWASVSTSDIGLTSAQDLIFAAGNFWLVGGSGKLAFSADGSAGSWTAVTSGFGTSQINRIIRANGVFVIVGASGKLATSSNGSSWTLVTSQFGTSSINDIAYGNARFVISGTSGKVAYSADDGATWTLATASGTTSTIDNLGFAGAQFLHTALSVVYKSVDGDTWVADTLPLVSNIEFVPHPVGLLISGIDGDGDRLAVTSADGNTWANLAAGIKNPLGKHPIYGYAENGTTRVLTSWSGIVSRSGDSGVTWTQMTSALGTGNINAIVQVGSRIFACGTSGALGVSDDNGATWSPRVTNTSSDIFRIIAGAGILLCSCASAKVLISNDNGDSWTEYTIAEFAGSGVEVQVFAGGRFIGLAGSNIVTSTDGITWIVTPAPGGTSGKMAYGNGLVVTLNGTNTVYISADDGLTWQAYQSSLGSVSGLIFIDGMFVAASGGYSHISVDGKNWARGQYFASPLLLGVGVGTVVGMYGSDNAIALSDDGQTWELCGYANQGESAISKYSVVVTDDVIIIGSSGGSVHVLSRGYDRTTHFALPPAQANTYIKAA